MAKKNLKFSADQFGASNDTETTNEFYFGKTNFKWMLIGLTSIILGFVLMMGPDANTIDGKFDSNVWNDGIFSVIRIRIAPLLVVIGFVIEIYAILKSNTK